jgi:hypothetical protein
MASVIIQGARRTNADIAGHTYVPDLEGHTPGAPAIESPTELAGRLPGVLDGFSFISGGTHPENIVPDIHSTAETVATDSKVGRLGGLVPRSTGTVAPGPSGGAAQAKATLAKVRSRLRI